MMLFPIKGSSVVFADVPRAEISWRKLYIYISQCFSCRAEFGQVTWRAPLTNLARGIASSQKRRCSRLF